MEGMMSHAEWVSGLVGGGYSKKKTLITSVNTEFFQLCLCDAALGFLSVGTGFGGVGRYMPKATVPCSKQFETIPAFESLLWQI